MITTKINKDNTKLVMYLDGVLVAILYDKDWDHTGESALNYFSSDLDDVTDMEWRFTPRE